MYNWNITVKEFLGKCRISNWVKIYDPCDDRWEQWNLYHTQAYHEVIHIFGDRHIELISADFIITSQDDEPCFTITLEEY